MQTLKVENIITEINLLEGFSNRSELAEERIHKLEDRFIEIMQSKDREWKKMNNALGWCETLILPTCIWWEYNKDIEKHIQISNGWNFSQFIEKT